MNYCDMLTPEPRHLELQTKWVTPKIGRPKNLKMVKAWSRGMLHALSLAELEDDDDEDEERWAYRLRSSVAHGRTWPVRWQRVMPRRHRWCGHWCGLLKSPKKGWKTTVPMMKHGDFTSLKFGQIFLVSYGTFNFQNSVLVLLVNTAWLSVWSPAPGWV